MSKSRKALDTTGEHSYDLECTNVSCGYEVHDIMAVDLSVPKGCNVILGISHFIKTVEDIFETMINTVPGSKFGVAFCEASGPCLVRSEGTDDELQRAAVENALMIGAGHFFVIIIRDSYPINYLNSLKEVREICAIYCATANPVQVLVVETVLGRGVVGVVDGEKTRGVESQQDVIERRTFLRKIGYKK